MMSVRTIARSPITWVLTGLLVIGVGVGLALFEPWRLFTDTTVNEAAPSVASPVSSGATSQHASTCLSARPDSNRADTSANLLPHRAAHT